MDRTVAHQLKKNSDLLLYGFRFPAVDLISSIWKFFHDIATFLLDFMSRSAAVQGFDPISAVKSWFWSFFDQFGVQIFHSGKSRVCFCNI